MIAKTMEKPEYREVFSKMGYNVDLYGAGLFESMLEEVRMLLASGATEEEIRKVLPDYYREDFHFYFEIGENEYFEQMKEFCSSRKISKKEKSIINRKELKIPSKKNLSVEDSLLRFAKYFNKLNKNLYEGKKVIVKTPTSGIVTNV